MRDWIILIGAALILLATGINARAADRPQLPQGVTCELVRAKVAEHGRAYAYAWARLHGYTAADIRDARRICGV